MMTNIIHNHDKFSRFKNLWGESHSLKAFKRYDTIMVWSIYLCLKFYNVNALDCWAPFTNMI